jgi:hypothetical protein
VPSLARLTRKAERERLPVYLHMAVEGVAQGTDKLGGLSIPCLQTEERLERRRCALSPGAPVNLQTVEISATFQERPRHVETSPAVA